VCLCGLPTQVPSLPHFTTLKFLSSYVRNIKDNILSTLCSLLFGVGEGYMNESIVAGISVSLGLMGIIYLRNYYFLG
jgi:hypothetical protein